MPRKKSPAAARAPMAVQWIDAAALTPHPKNSRRHDDAQIASLRASVREFGVMRPIIVDETRTILAGHGLWMALKAEGHATVPILERRGLTALQKRAYVIADNRLAQLSDWDESILAVEIGDLRAADFNLAAIGWGEPVPEQSSAGALAEKFIAPPFSVLDARQGWWQDRKRAWLALGIKSELGRGENLLRFSDNMLAAQAGKRPYARTFGQDLMRGEHVVGRGRRAKA